MSMNSVTRDREFNRIKTALLTSQAEKVRIVLWAIDEKDVQSIADISELFLSFREGYLPLKISGGKNIASWARNYINKMLNKAERFNKFRVGIEEIWKDGRITSFKEKPVKTPKNQDRHEVIVGNIGEVYNGCLHKAAGATYTTYVEKSKIGEGRAAGEPVTWLINGDIYREYPGGNPEENEESSLSEEHQQRFNFALTVDQLKEELDQFPGDAKVFFCYPSGDHWRTEIAISPKSFDQEKVKYSPYHDQFTPADEDEEEVSAPVILIR